jgi:hypothetical protein
LRLCFILGAIFLVAQATLSAEPRAAITLIVDVKNQSVTSDSRELEARFLKPMGGQLGVFVQNLTMDPKPVVLQFRDLLESRYDMYVNGKYLGVKSCGELQQGLSAEVPGRIVNSDLVLCLEKVRPLIDAEYSRLKDVKSPEPARICATLQQAMGWVRSALQVEKTYRSLTVVLAPEGHVLQRPPVPTRLDDEETIEAVTRACKLLHEARSRMSTVIKDVQLRDSAVTSLTPVDFATSFTIKNGKPQVEFVVTNYCNLPVSGKVTADVPAGWKSEKVAWSFSKLPTGRSYRATFSLSRNKSNATLPDGVRMCANMSLVQNALRADYSIRTIARSPKLTSAITPDAQSRDSSCSNPSDESAK